MTSGPVARRAVAIALLALLSVACIPPRPSPVPTTARPTATAGPTATPPAIVDTTIVTVDPTLLDLLPDAVAGVSLTPDAATAADLAAEGALAPFVESIAVAAAFGPVATDAGGDHVVVTVARLRPDTFGGTFYRGWRDTFDAAVCDQSGGVDGHAEAEISGHQTFIGTCVGGVRTYHVHLADRDVIVSMQAVGDGRFGERVVEGLTE